MLSLLPPQYAQISLSVGKEVIEVREHFWVLLLLRALSVSHQGASKLEGTVEDAAQVQVARPQAGQQGQ